jgi:hypothetical protein
MKKEQSVAKHSRWSADSSHRAKKKKKKKNPEKE